MLKAKEVRKVRILVSGEYLEKTGRKCGELGVMELKSQSIDLKLDEYKETERLKRIAKLEKKAWEAIEILEIEEEKDIVGAVVPKERIKEERSTEKNLQKAEDFIEEIRPVIQKEEKLEEWKEENNSLQNEEEILSFLEKVGGKLEWLGDSQFLTLKFGEIKLEDFPVIKEELDELETNYWIEEGTEDKASILLLTPKENKSELEEILRTIDWQEYSLPSMPINKRKKQIEERIQEINEKSKEAQKELEKIREEKGGKLLGMREIIENERRLLEFRTSSLKTKEVHCLEGWVPQEKIGELEEELEKVTDGHYAMRDFEAEDEKPPTYLKHLPYFNSFQPLVSGFGLPSLSEIDPTYFMAFTIPLFFGIMFGDVVHGLMIGSLEVQCLS